MTFVPIHSARARNEFHFIEEVCGFEPARLPADRHFKNALEAQEVIKIQLQAWHEGQQKHGDE